MWGCSVGTCGCVYGADWIHNYHNKVLGLKAVCCHL